jgi:hypothetical protein
MNGMKYIIIDDHKAIIFPATLYHADVFSLLKVHSSNRVTGAGYLGADKDGKLFVYGRSEGYGMDADPADLEFILAALHKDRASVQKPLTESSFTD